MTEVGRATVGYPGGLAARYRWGGSGSSEAVFALSESGGELTDLAELAGGDPARMCRAELRVEGPLGTWTVRFASPVFDEPAGLVWDTEAQLVVKYGFGVYGLAARTGELQWSHRSGTPIVVVLGSPRLDHVIIQSEVETIALLADGGVRWRVAHSDVISDAELTGGVLTLRSYGGEIVAIDPVSGQALG
ncbi:MAG: PQQ-binding-like beta-propeller repeat protein [Candidatus Limnocylindrales bacterium]